MTHPLLSKTSLPQITPSHASAHSDGIVAPEAGGENSERCFRDALNESRLQSRKIARNSRENFVVVSCLLPREFRQSFYDLYAFCRTADDLADEAESPQKALENLDRYRQRVGQMYDVTTDHPKTGIGNTGIFVALADTVRRHQMPRSLFDDLLDAFTQDQTKTHYADADELVEYCRRSANPVGRMILRLADSDDDKNVALSDEICTALQEANFWQDVSRDRLIGRVYLPGDAMRRHGLDPETIVRGLRPGETTPARVRAMVAELCEQTRARFLRGLPLADCVPNWLSADVRLFVQGGIATLDAIEAIDFDVLRVRPVVSKRTKAAMVAGAVWRNTWPARFWKQRSI